MKRIIPLAALLVLFCLTMNSCGTAAALIYMAIADSEVHYNENGAVTPPYNDEMNSTPEINDNESNKDPDDPKNDNDITHRPDDNEDPSPDDPNPPSVDQPKPPQAENYVQILAEGEAVWRYRVAAVVWGSDDYTWREIDEFGEFIADNPNWTYINYNDSDWDSRNGPFGDRVWHENANETNWNGDNHGIFLRTTFDITADDINKIKSGDAKLHAWMWYDNSCHIYINGVEVFMHDDSHLFVEGTIGEFVGGHDWNDAYEDFPLDGSNDHYVYSGNIADLLAEGENTIAVSLLDCWGGREFDLGLYVEHLN